jgi:hypothetical protein
MGAAAVHVPGSDGDTVRRLVGIDNVSCELKTVCR